MYRYEVEITLTENNSTKWKKAIVSYSKSRQSFVANDPDKIAICKKAAIEMGENPSLIDFNHSNTTCKYIGKEEAKEESKSKDTKKSEKSFWTPAWAIPFKMIWFLFRWGLFFWI